MDIIYHKNELIENGWTKIPQYISEDEVTYCLKNINKLTELTVKEFKQKNPPLKPTETIYRNSKYADIRIDAKGIYVDRLQRVFTPASNPIYKQGLKLLHKLVNTQLEFFKDRYIIQYPMTECGLPHQDGSTSNYGRLYNNFYTIYISLGDTIFERGALFIEDIRNKRTESLNLCELGCMNPNTKCICCDPAICDIHPNDYFEITTHNKYPTKHKMKPHYLKTGDAVIFDGYVLHGVGRNISDTIRKTLTICYVEHQ